MKKVLIIRFSSIGDIVLTTPVIRCLKLQHPEVIIHYLTKKNFQSILENNPYLKKVFVIEKRVGEVILELKKENYDVIIDLHNNLRTQETILKLGKPAISFKKLNFKKWLLVNFKLNKMPAIHIVDRYMKTVEKLSVKNDFNGLDYFIPIKEEVALSSLPITHQQGYIAFVIGAKHFTKQLPTQKIISICKKANKPIVLLGSKEDESRALEITSSLGSQVFNACGVYSINQSASLIKQASKVISHDTGLMHIAAAFKKEIISVWGNTVPEFGFSPYMPDSKSKIVEVKNLSCRPCSKIGYDHCPKKHFKCMTLIDENAFF